VLDEKMKDAVKITVIATGFKDSDIRRRQQESHTTFGAVARDFDDSFDRTPAPEPESDPLPPPPPMVMESAPQPVALASNQVIELDAMRSAMIANFEQSDLDVPAFLRKRNETM